ncbi:MAG: response regulator transcription factor [Ignavibacteriales bacterium]|nr:response regulator transcription factor [Ignavibacteriales bacterium]
MDKIRIVIADDHPVFLKGMRFVISEEEEIEVVAEASDGIKALTLINQLHPDIAVLDIDMPGKTGFEILRELSDQKSKCKIIFLTMHNASDLLLESLKLGVKGYLLKENALSDIITAIRLVKKGQRYITASLSDAVLNINSPVLLLTIVGNNSSKNLLHLKLKFSISLQNKKPRDK